MSIRFSVYYNSPENGEYLRQAINALGGIRLVAADDLSHLPLQGENGSDILFVEYQEDNAALDQWIEKTAANPQSPPIFLYFQEISTNCLWKALRLGAKECFTYPVKAEELQKAATRVLARATRHEDSAQSARMVSFLGSKGGVGTTLVAANTALALSQKLADEILLIDLDLRYGQLNYFLDAQPQHTLTELTQNIERLDSAYLRSTLYTYAKNLYLLPAPARLEEAEAITPEQIEQILRSIKNSLGLQWVFLDCGHEVDEFSIRALELSEELVLIANATIPALSNARKILELLKLLNLQDLKTRLWLNCWENQGDLSLEEVVNFLGVKVNGTLPFARKEVEQSINEGKPLLELIPRHPLAVCLKGLAESIRGTEGAEGPQNSPGRWFARLWRKG
jgi:pilus assembly protein CpaE